MCCVVCVCERERERVRVQHVYGHVCIVYMGVCVHRCVHRRVRIHCVCGGVYIMCVGTICMSVYGHILYVYWYTVCGVWHVSTHVYGNHFTLNINFTIGDNTATLPDGWLPVGSNSLAQQVGA